MRLSVAGGESQLFSNEWPNFRQAGQPLVADFTNPSNPTLALPFLASDSAGRLVLQFIQSDLTDSSAQAVFFANVSDPTPSNPDPGPIVANWRSFTTTGFFNPSPNNNVRAKWS
jgi:hypothetical protein